jgi:hypothetical protein
MTHPLEVSVQTKYWVVTVTGAIAVAFRNGKADEVVQFVEAQQQKHLRDKGMEEGK